MNNSILWEENKFRIPFISTLIILFSLSCDESEPTSVSSPDLSYNIEIQSQVRNCEQVSCMDDLDNEAYGANVNCEETSCEDSYHLYFQITLTDQENDPIANAILTIGLRCALPDILTWQKRLVVAQKLSLQSKGLKDRGLSVKQTYFGRI